MTCSSHESSRGKAVIFEVISLARH